MVACTFVYKTKGGYIMIKVIVIIAIILIIMFIIRMINVIKENKSKVLPKPEILPPNYRLTPWTNDWIRPCYKCGGCEHGYLRRCIRGEFRGYCAKYDMLIDCDTYVCDDYLEHDQFSSFRTDKSEFKPLSGHFDHSPFNENKHGE